MEEQVRAFLASLDATLAYSSNTRQAYWSDLRCFVAYLEKQLNRPPHLEDFCAQQVTNFLEAERQGGRQPSTLLRRRASLRRFARFLQEAHPERAGDFNLDEDWVGSSAAESESASDHGYLNAAHIQSLWTTLDASRSPRARRDQAILALMLENGISVSTLVALDLADADLEQELIRLRLENGQEVWLPLRQAAAPLKCYLREGRPELSRQPEEPALFISQTGGRMCRQGIWQMLRHWGQRAHLPVHLSPRSARHTAAVQLAQSGRPLSEIQVLLGHSNPLSTRALLRRLAVHPVKPDGLREEAH